MVHLLTEGETLPVVLFVAVRKPAAVFADAV